MSSDFQVLLNMTHLGFFFQSFTNDQTFGSPSAIEKQKPDWTGMASQFSDVWSEGCTCDPCKAKSCWERVCASSFSAMMAADIFVDRWSDLACGRGE